MVPGGLEAIDFDHLEAFDRFEEVCQQRGLSGLLDHVRVGYVETTPHGAHLLHRSATVGGSQKLAEEVDAVTVSEHAER